MGSLGKAKQGLGQTSRWDGGLGEQDRGGQEEEEEEEEILTGRCAVLIEAAKSARGVYTRGENGKGKRITLPDGPLEQTPSGLHDGQKPGTTLSLVDVETGTVCVGFNLGRRAAQ